MKIIRLRDLAWSVGAIFLLSLPAFGQQVEQKQQTAPGQMQQQQQPQQPQQKNQQRDQRQQAAGGQSAQQLELIAFGIEPITQVAVSYDFDEDGVIDAIDYVSPNLPPMVFLDQPQGRQGTQAAGRQRPGKGQSAAAYKVQGTVQDLRTAKMMGTNEQQVFALVKTQKGKDVAVNLGPQWKVNQLQVKKGDQITAFGRIGQVDEKPVLNAFSARSGDQRITIPAARGQMTQTEKNADRYNVTVLNTRTVNLPGGPSVVMSKVRLQDGSTTLVNLGPSSAVKNLNLQANQNIRLLARPTQIAGQKALIAERIAAGNQQVDIDWNQLRTGQAQGASPG